VRRAHAGWARRAAAAALLLFAVATVGTLIAQEATYSESAADGIPAPSEEPASEAAIEPTTDPGGATSEPVDEIADEAPPGAPAEPSADEPERDPSPLASAPAIAEAAAPRCTVDAIYFHNTARCYTCKKIEATAKSVLEAEFEDQFADGRLRWSAVNMEEERRFVEQYGLVRPTLILVRRVNDEPVDWIALEEAWTLIRNESRFTPYVATGADNFLGGCP